MRNWNPIDWAIAVFVAGGLYAFYVDSIWDGPKRHLRKWLKGVLK